ncbi:MAG: hypothetical protein KTR19_01440 [Hyphomicrobiales bacterium]|nr:hypothetical protein [Hyphomicrobiales bacterium]
MQDRPPLGGRDSGCLGQRVNRVHMMNNRPVITERDLYETALQEYKELEADIRLFTENSMRTKNWSIMVGAAGIFIAFIHKQPTILLLTPFAAILFWTVDARWRSYLVCFIQRQKEIERYFLQERRYIGPQINRSFDRNFMRMQQDLSPWNLAKSPSIHIPHSLIAFVAIFAYVLMSMGFLSFS